MGMSENDLKSSPSNLSFATTDELIAELQKRSRASIIATIPIINEMEYSIRFFGKRLTLLGLITMVRRDILREMEAP